MNGPGTAAFSEIEAQTLELTTQAFEAFGEDLACMLGLEATGKDLGLAACKLADLKKQFKKMAMAGTVSSEGKLAGNFFIILDQEAFFTLAGVLVVQPEKVIIQNRKFGNKESAADVSDAVGEIGNLLIGSFDRIFRESNTGHGHFVYKKTFIGDVWANPSDSIGLKAEEELVVSNYEMNIAPYGPCKLAAAYPKTIFAGEQKPETAVPKPEEAKDQKSQPAVETAAQQQPAKPAQAEPSKPAEVPVAEQTPVAAKTEPIKSETKSEVGPDVSPKQQEQSVAAESKKAAVAPTENAVASAENGGPVLESIRKMTQSPATLPGQSVNKSVPVCEIMRKDIFWASPDDTVESAINSMGQNNCRYLLVGKDKTLEGIVSHGDLRGATSPYLMNMFAHWRRPLDLASMQIRIKWVMTKPVITIRNDCLLSDAAAQMKKAKVGCLPVIDASCKVEGIITHNEILGFLAGL